MNGNDDLGLYRATPEWENGGSLIHAAYIFRTSVPIPGIFDTLFGGIFLVKGIPLAAQLLVLLLFPTAVLLLAAEQFAGRRPAGRAAEAVGVCLFALLAFFVLQPWDEVFINLRHSLHLAENGVFSFNRSTAVEGTVDFLPYFALGLLHRLGLPLVELAFTLSFAGGLMCLFALRRLGIDWGLARYRSALVVGLSTFPPLIFNSSNGFANSVFTADILWAIHFLFFSPRCWLGVALLALLPTIRLEGAWFSFLLLSFWFADAQTRSKQRMGWLVVSSLPTLALSAYRQYHFGSWCPVPIRYKAGLGNFFLTVVGLRNAAADFIASGTVVAVFILIACTMVDGHRRQLLKPHSALRRGTEIALILAVACAPYYLGGGDWFPSYWARYLLPFVLLTVVLSLAVLTRSFTDLVGAPRRFLVVAPALVFALHLLWPISSYRKLGEQFFAHRRTMARIHPPTVARGHYRIQHLSQLGNHFLRTTQPDAVIASSEIATIMYFAHRDALDLLGVTNPEIAAAPLRQFPSLLRKFPERSELPYLIFKRVKPDLIARYQPPYLYTFDFMTRDLLAGLPGNEITDAYLFIALHRWEKKLGGLMDTLYGGLSTILDLGYRPIIVSYADDFTSLYFVSPAAIGSHLRSLKKAGFEGGWVSEMPSGSGPPPERDLLTH